MLEKIRETERLKLLVNMKNAAVALENNLADPQKLKTELQYDPAIPFLDLHPRE